VENKLLDIINVVRDNKGLITLEKLDASNDLRTDIGFDSLDLAELTVRIEKELGIDIFATGYVLSVGDILAKLNTHSS
jgi:acyl carrier protein